VAGWLFVCIVLCYVPRSSYLQVDVIDAAFSKLRESLNLEKSRDFESVVAAHAEFLTVISAQ
jgi:hypothetical protein